MRLVLLVLLLATSPSVRAQYDPLRIDPPRADQHAAPLDLSVDDQPRAREIPLRVYLPDSSDPAPLAMFSHGLGGSREMSAYLGKHWSARGYVVVFLQHPGSDDSVWKEARPLQRMAAMRQAANLENFLLRAGDVPATIDALQRWNSQSGHALAGRIDLQRIGMSGHSFGAVTTQAVSGQSPPVGKGFTDPRIKAAVVMSPSTPRGGSAAKAFADVSIPWMLLTGTKDISPIGGADLDSRLGVYPALPPGDKYELVMHNAQHSAFTERALPGEKHPRNPNHHRAILAVTTAFWDAYLKDDAQAKQWLAGDAVRGVLEADDTWKKK
ncbi:Alpha/beta hydrolase family protein [Pirellulimonas nuda]|uniref:Alpha/beta hydrolase family protein n=1 Tax=Pirellulimonas nuda TaxID=2528009 RepID=A0A518DFJ2_9BACT|nr:dienelactone hydrolase [Pirellulimonas nuda]QDU90253.1 Alpha/beta hydrolase family protein [Pirellulimonas nuda]